VPHWEQKRASSGLRCPQLVQNGIVLSPRERSAGLSSEPIKKARIP